MIFWFPLPYHTRFDQSIFLGYYHHMKKIIQLGDERLRIVCDPIPESYITSKESQKLIKDLNTALASQKDGVAISAPQIGETKQLFVIGGIVFDKDYQNRKTETPDPSIKNRYFFNPRIIKTSKEVVAMEEGCLSIRGVYGKVVRPKKIVLEYWNENGEKIQEGASGFLARVMQHELDHLHGVLFIDKATETWQDDTYKQY
jgi:peptide deformylase